MNQKKCVLIFDSTTHYIEIINLTYFQRKSLLWYIFTNFISLTSGSKLNLHLKVVLWPKKQKVTCKTRLRHHFQHFLDCLNELPQNRMPVVLSKSSYIRSQLIYLDLPGILWVWYMQKTDKISIRFSTCKSKRVFCEKQKRI